MTYTCRQTGLPIQVGHFYFALLGHYHFGVTSDAAGVSKIYLTGYTPLPVDVLGSPRRDIQKTALGAERYVAWQQCRDIGRLIARLKKEGVCIVALEQAPHATDYRIFKPAFPLALLVGNEVRGLSTRLLRKCDAVMSIPMRGKKESLNVAAAFGIAVYQLLGFY